ncbi:winged helix family transcriptional regulator, partial [Aeromonas hydrophila]
PQARRQYTRRKYDRYFSPKRILLFALLLVSLTSLAIVIYNYATANTLRTINLSQISLYMTSETEKALNVKIDSLTPLIQRISRKADEQVSILVGKEAISYFSIDNNSRKLSENVFLLRSGHPVAEEVQCVITTMTQQGDNVSHNYYNNPDTTVRYHSNCQAPDNWVEMTRKSKFIVTMNREIVVATVIATDNQGKTLFNLDSVGDLERDDGDISVEVKNTIVNFIDQQALTSNGMVATLVAALTPPKQTAQFVQLPGGIYLSNYLGGVITWPSLGNSKVIQRNDL